MQLISDEMMDLEDNLILDGEEDEGTVSEDEANSPTNSGSVMRKKTNNVVLNESMTWSLLQEDDVIHDGTEQENEDEVEEESSQGHRSILPVDSCDSIPSNYDINTLQPKSDTPKSTTEKEVATTESDQSSNIFHIEKPNITVNRDLEQKLNTIEDMAEIYLQKVKDFSQTVETVPKWLITLIWFITLLFTIRGARQSFMQTKEIENLRQEIESLQNTISELKRNKTVNERPGWFAQSSEIMKEWATALTYPDLRDFSFSERTNNETTFLDVIPDIFPDIIPAFNPNEAFDAVKNFSSHVAATIGEVFDDVGTNTKDVFSSVGESVTSFGEGFSSVETVTEKIQNISGTMFDILESQKYALIFGAVYYQVYENFFNELKP